MMRIEVNNQVLQLIGNEETGLSMFIGNEYDPKVSDVFIEDISELQNQDINRKVKELQKMLSEALTEVKDMAVEAFDNEPMIEGSISDAESHLDEAEGLERKC